jgi:hypothetical protein
MIFRLAGIAARRARAAQAPSPTPDDFEDSSDVYGLTDAEILEALDTENTCTDPGGHVWLRGRCLHCGERDA